MPETKSNCLHCGFKEVLICDGCTIQDALNLRLSAFAGTGCFLRLSRSPAPRPDVSGPASFLAGAESERGACGTDGAVGGSLCSVPSEPDASPGCSLPGCLLPDCSPLDCRLLGYLLPGCSSLDCCLFGYFLPGCSLPDCFLLGYLLMIVLLLVQSSCFSVEH